MKCKKCKCKVNKEDLVIKWINYFCSTFCYVDYIDNQKETKKPIAQRKAINKISLKKKQRIKEWWSEVQLFKEIWNERKKECENCKRELTQARVHNFDHIIPKSRWEEFRLDKSNIKLICFKCHFEKTNWLVYKWIDLDF